MIRRGHCNSNAHHLQETETKEHRRAEKNKVYEAPIEQTEATAEERLRKRKTQPTEDDEDDGRRKKKKKRKSEVDSDE